MGLDMYLNARKYMSKVKYVNGEQIPLESFSTLVSMSGLENLTKYSGFGGIEISYPIGYWRKANAIHGWFVNNLAGGVDECQPIEVSRGDLQLLLTGCKEVLAETDPDEKSGIAEDRGLTPTEGFFFGSYELDEYYDADLKYTIEMLEHVLSLIPEDNYDWNFIYQASW